MDEIERAIRYIQSCEPAISGSGGQNQTFKLACHLFKTFGLDSGAVFDLIHQHYNPRCQPPWTDKELQHKVDDAARATGGGPGVPMGNLTRVSNNPVDKIEKKKPGSVTFVYQGGTTRPMPTEEEEDGTRRLLRAAFNSGEGVRIVHAHLKEDGTEAPSKGVTLSRDEWLSKLDERGGDPNKLFSREGDPGIYIGINPLAVGKTKDADVTAFRHVLLEFDNLSLEEQWKLYLSSEIPITAVIHSGGKSLHAWVRVDAKDRKEYDERVQSIYTYFEDHNPDTKNKNPGRLSRLPNCVRLGSRQQLIAMHIGKESFTEWMGDQQLEGIGRPLTIDELLLFRPDEDPNCMIGARWLCKGGSCLLIGPSGVGKSSITTQAAIRWGSGLPFFGITPIYELKSLIIQAENDEGDIAEQVQGVLEGMEISPFDRDKIDKINENVVFVRDAIHTGEAFTAVLQRLIDRHKPHIVWIDPLLSFIGADISKQEVCSHFLRNLLNPISAATGVIFMCIHHTGKPPKDKKTAQAGWNSSDFAYLGIGSSELTNWARAVMVLQQVNNTIFELKLAKRGSRAEALDLAGNMTTSLFLRHSDVGLNWIQVERPEPDEDEQPRRKKKHDDGGEPGTAGRPPLNFDYNRFYESIKGESFTINQLVSRAASFAGCSTSTIHKKVLTILKERMEMDEKSGKWSH